MSRAEVNLAVRRERKRVYRKVARDLRLLHEGSLFEDRKRGLLTTLDRTAAAVLEEYATIYERLGRSVSSPPLPREPSEDSKRLDWLQDNAEDEEGLLIGGICTWRIDKASNMVSEGGEDLRDAIDLARGYLGPDPVDGRSSESPRDTAQDAERWRWFLARASIGANEDAVAWLGCQLGEEDDGVIPEKFCDIVFRGVSPHGVLDAPADVLEVVDDLVDAARGGS